ncbi:adhesion G protein-coupled receptor F4-like [Discoglossus pictus]
MTKVTNGVSNCFCNHLTSFSVLMSSYIPNDEVNYQVLDYITTIGLVISIVSLMICIAIQAILLSNANNLMASYRHVCILNMSVFLLLGNISFIGSSYTEPEYQDHLCVAFTFSTHLSLLSFLCWTLVQTIFLVCRLVFVFHHVTKKEFMTLAVVLGYLCPIAIAVGTFLCYSPSNKYRQDNACWLDNHSGASMAFTIPTIVIISINFLALIVVIRKLLRPSLSEGSGEDEEVVKKLVKAVVFCTPQFGLTWAVGIPLFADGSLLILHYMFVLLNPLQGFFILLFGCLLDKKVVDLLKRRVLKSSPVGSTATTVSTY